jgi:hypothetical protein
VASSSAKYSEQWRSEKMRWKRDYKLLFKSAFYSSEFGERSRLGSRMKMNLVEFFKALQVSGIGDLNSG